MMVALVFFIAASALLVVGMTGPSSREFATVNQAVLGTAGYYLAESAAEDVYYRTKNTLSLGPVDTLTLPIGSASATTAVYGSGQKEIQAAASVFTTGRALDIIHNDGSVNFDITSWIETR